MPPIRIVKNSVGQPRDPQRRASTGKPATSLAAHRARAGQVRRSGGGGWIKWVVVTGFVVVVAVVFVVAANRRHPPVRAARIPAPAAATRAGRAVSHDANGYRNTLLDDVDLRKWSLEHDKKNEQLQARRDRMKQPPRR